MTDKVEWNVAPHDLGIYEQTTSKCGEWKVFRIPGGTIYTQWRCALGARVTDDIDWQPFASFFVRNQQ